MSQEFANNVIKNSKLHHQRRTEVEGIFAHGNVSKIQGEASIEKKIRECLEQFHIKFRQRQKIGRYHADFLIENTKIIIECDGIYWHSLEHAQKEIFIKHFSKQKGYRVYRFPEEEINQSP
jgi:very-short-patch-repair endonuclease